MMVDTLPSTYLGMPFFQERNLGNLLDLLVGKIQKKILSWK